MPISETLRYPSVISLIIANFVPVFGVLFFEWNIRDIFYIYFFETIIIGFYSVCHLWQAPASKLRQVVGINLERFVYIAVFCFTYGMGVASTGVFLNLLIPMYDTDLARIGPALLVLFLSHGVSYFVNFLGNKEFESQSLQEIFIQPFKRLMFPNLFIIFVLFPFLAFFGTVGSVIALAIFRTCIDLKMHIWEHEFFWQKIGEGSFSGRGSQTEAML